MTLEVGRILIEEVKWGQKTLIKKRTLYIDKDELIEKAQVLRTWLNLASRLMGVVGYSRV